MTDKTLREMALHYHRYPRPGKLSITATKPLSVTMAEKIQKMRDWAKERAVRAN